MDKKEQKSATFKSGSDTSLSAGKEITMEATKLDSEGKVDLTAKENINLKAVEDTEKSVKLGGGVEIGLKGIGTEAEAGGKYKETHQGVEIKSKSDTNIETGGKLIKEGAKIESEGKETINAEKGVESTELKKDIDIGAEIGGGIKLKADLEKGDIGVEAEGKAGGAEGRLDKSVQKEPPKKVQKMFDRVDSLMKTGKSLDETLKFLGIDKKEYQKMKKEYGGKK